MLQFNTDIDSRPMTHHVSTCTNKQYITIEDLTNLCFYKVIFIFLLLLVTIIIKAVYLYLLIN